MQRDFIFSKHLVSLVFYTSAMVVFGYGQSVPSSNEVNIIAVSKSDYGLIFTDIIVNGTTVRAMIDFGDPHSLQLSSTLVEQQKIAMRATGRQVSDVFGNTWELQEGSVEKVTIGNWAAANVVFTSQNGEMEAVSEQIGTIFHAVVGWGYFKDYFTEIDYADNKIILYKHQPEISDHAFTTTFSIESGYLILKAGFNGEDIYLMLDTGAPVTFIDSTFQAKYNIEQLQIELGGALIILDVYAQDMSVLSDLGVVGMLGGDFLSAHRVFIDTQSNVLVFLRKE